MKGLIEFALRNPRAITVGMLALVMIGGLCLTQVPVDILPVYDQPAVQVMTFYSGMPPESVASAITDRMERWTGTAAGQRKQESRSILGVSVIRNYFREGVDPNGALTQVNSLALAEIPNLPPGTLPPIVLPYDPTATVPTCLVALDSSSQNESTLYDVARYEVRNLIMNSPGADAPVVYGGTLRAVLAYLDRTKLESRGLSPLDVLQAIENYNVFLPTGDAKLGRLDFAIDSNSMFDLVSRMREIPLRRDPGSSDFLGDVADPQDSHLIQMNAVRVNGKRQVYIPVYRQHGSSTLAVVDNLRKAVPQMQLQLTQPDIDLKMVMDQSVYVRQSIRSLVIESLLGALLCSLVILLFLGELRMTAIAIITIPTSILSAVIGLYYTGETINVMTLAGIALAIGPLVDCAIVILENTHRHLSRGDPPRQAALEGASEVAMPELVATISTLLVLAPLGIMPSSGRFLFKPMALSVAFAMVAAYLLSQTFVPVRCANWLRGHGKKQKKSQGAPAGGEQPRAEKNEGAEDAAAQSATAQENAAAVETDARPGRLRHAMSWFGHTYQRFQDFVEKSIEWYRHLLDHVMQHRWLVVGVPLAVLAAMVLLWGPRLRRDFMPEVDAGAFDIFVRAASGTKLEETEREVAKVEKLLKQELGDDLDLVISNIGIEADWSAAYTPNAGPMDAVLKVQLTESRKHSAQDYVTQLRGRLAEDPQLVGLEFAFDAGGMVRSALNEGRTTPINIQISGKHTAKARQVAEKIRRAVGQIDGVVDARVMQRHDYPEYVIDVDRAKARELGVTQTEIMKNVISAIKSSIQFNKKNFWIDPVSQNQYFVGVQYPEDKIQSLDTLRNVPITSRVQTQPIPLSNVASIHPTTIAAEVTHTNLQTTIDVTLSVEGRDLGHVAADIDRELDQFGKRDKSGFWTPYDPNDESGHTVLAGSKLTLTGEYTRMQDTFREFALGAVLAVVLIYFLMVSLFDSYVVPLTILLAVPASLIGVIPLLWITGTAVNVESLLGMVFVVGIVVSNTVLLTDVAQKLRADGKNPTEAICEAARLRARPVVMTALAAFFALLPMALAIERGSEANAPLGRAVIGGLWAGLLTTLIVVPALYSLMVRGDLQNKSQAAEKPAPA